MDRVRVHCLNPLGMGPNPQPTCNTRHILEEPFNSGNDKANTNRTFLTIENGWDQDLAIRDASERSVVSNVSIIVVEISLLN